MPILPVSQTLLEATIRKAMGVHAAWLDGLPVCELFSLEETSTRVSSRPLAETLTSAPELEVWRHRDGGAG